MLPDVNIWLALAFESHKHHRDALVWFSGIGTSGVSFCRLTMLGFLRLVQNPSAFPGEAVSGAEAWTFYQAFRADERVTFQDEPPGIEELLATFFAKIQGPSPKQVTDAYLAAFSRLAGLPLHTFDNTLKTHPLLKP